MTELAQPLIVPVVILAAVENLSCVVPGQVCAFADDPANHGNLSQLGPRLSLWQGGGGVPISTEAMSFVEGLLEPEPFYRLGMESMGGYAALKAHPFFQERHSMPEFDWETFSSEVAAISDDPATPDSAAAEPSAKKRKKQTRTAAAHAPAEANCIIS